MNYYEPKQRKTDGRWVYTRNNYPVGYCCEYKEIDPKLIPISEAEQESYRVTAHKHHADGHETEKEACECYKKYLLDHRLSLNRKMSNQQEKCKICGEWTQGFAEIDCQLFVLCGKHNNIESVETLYKAPSWSCSSW